MKMEIFVNPIFFCQSDFVCNIPKNYSLLGLGIHNEQNEGRIVKYYKRITYTIIQKSKVLKAYEYSTLLLQNGMSLSISLTVTSRVQNHDYYVSLDPDFKPQKEIPKLLITAERDVSSAIACYVDRCN